MNKPSVEGMYTFNGRLSSNLQWYDDHLFDDVYYIPNLYQQPYKTGEEIGKLLETGLSYCYKNCSGTCLEYGMTGNAYCFINRKYNS
jgi:hypothetical protein